MSDIPDIKTYLRKKMKKIRSDIPNKEIPSDKACEYLYSYTKKAYHILSFAPFRNEIDIEPFNIRLSKENRLALPKVEKNQLRFYLIEDYQNQLKISSLGIKEPISAKCNLVQSYDLVLVPGLAFDVENNRLGYGKGFYDRFLKENSMPTLAIGYKQQLVASVPVTYLDGKVDSCCLF